jgi:hypothetical protein
MAYNASCLATGLKKFIAVWLSATALARNEPAITCSAGSATASDIVRTTEGLDKTPVHRLTLDVCPAT